MNKKPLVISQQHYNALREGIRHLKRCVIAMDNLSAEAERGGSGPQFVNRRQQMRAVIDKIEQTKRMFDPMPLVSMSKLDQIWIKFAGKPVTDDTGHIWAYTRKGSLYVVSEPKGETTWK